MPLSYAGVSLPLETDEVRAYLDQFHSLDRLVEQSLGGVIADGLDDIQTPPFRVAEPPRIGVLSWPRDCSRTATFHAVVNSTKLAQIRTATASSPYQNLVLSDGVHGPVTASMRMLPPRPLFQIAGTEQLYLLSLVDRRYDWTHYISGDVSDTTNWTALLDDLSGLLGNVLGDTDTVDTDYGTPSDRWLLYRKPVTTVVDAVAATLGRKLSCSLDGTLLNLAHWQTANVSAATQYNLYKRCGGGRLSVDDIARHCPASVAVVFTKEISGEYQDDPYVITKTFAATKPTEFGTATALPGTTATIFADLIYDATNAAACDAYAAQAATDYYGWFLCDVDATFAGIVPWVPTGAEDVVEWTYSLTDPGPRLTTRVQRGPWPGFPTGDYKLSRGLLGSGGGGGSGFNLTVREVDGSPTVSGVVVAEFASGFVVTNPSPNVARIGHNFESVSDNLNYTTVTNNLNYSTVTNNLNYTTVTNNLNYTTLTANLNFVTIADELPLGCGLMRNAGAVMVAYDDLAGDRFDSSLVVLEDTPCDSLGVDLAAIASTTEDLVTDVTLSSSGTNLVLDLYKREFTNWFNRAALHIDRTAAVETASTLEIDLCPIISACLPKPATGTCTGQVTVGQGNGLLKPAPGFFQDQLKNGEPASQFRQLLPGVPCSSVNTVTQYVQELYQQGTVTKPGPGWIQKLYLRETTNPPEYEFDIETEEDAADPTFTWNFHIDGTDADISIYKDESNFHYDWGGATWKQVGTWDVAGITFLNLCADDITCGVFSASRLPDVDGGTWTTPVPGTSCSTAGTAVLGNVLSGTLSSGSHWFILSGLTAGTSYKLVRTVGTGSPSGWTGTCGLPMGVSLDAIGDEFHFLAPSGSMWVQYGVAETYSFTLLEV